MTPAEIKAKLAAHRLWIADPSQGSRADFTGAVLRGADLSLAYFFEAILRSADLRDADLRGAILRGADLTGANLRGVNLQFANLRGVNLRGANLRGADLRGADLSWVNFDRAVLTGAKLDNHTVGEGRHATFNLGYWAMTTRSDQGQRWLQYGCETHRLYEWDLLLGDLAKQHHPEEAARYEDETRALVALCRTMDTEEETQ